MKAIVNILLVLLICGSVCGEARATTAGNRLSRVEIVGNREFSANQLKNWLGLKRNVLVTTEQVREQAQLMLDHLTERGYFFARVDSIAYDYNADSSQVGVTLSLDEGKRTKVESVQFEGVDSTATQIRADLQTQAGNLFSPAVLEQDIEYLIAHYEARGHPYARVEVSQLRLAPDNADTEQGLHIRLQVDPGPAVQIDDIEIVGNTQTRASVVLRELPVAVGDLYNQEEIDRIRPKLLKLGFFKWVNPPRLELLDGDRGRLVIELAEGSHNRFDGVIGYNPATAASDGFVTGLLDIRFGNLFGTGRKAEARWERRTEKTQEFRLSYTEPWVAGLPINAGFGFEQLIQDTSYVQRQIGLNASVLFGDNISLFSRISRSTISPDSLARLRFSIPASSSLNLELGLAFDTLTEPLNPRNGVRYRTAFEWSRKRVRQPDADMGDESFNLKRLSVDFENYFSIFRWQVVAIALHGREITTDEPVVQLTDQYRFGGTKTLRGYREEQFRGSRIAWANFEYRYLLGRHSRFFLFFDLGYFFRQEIVQQNLVARDGVKPGYGLGLRLDTPLGFFGIDYGLGEGDSFSNGKVHIGLTNEF